MDAKLNNVVHSEVGQAQFLHLPQIIRAHVVHTKLHHIIDCQMSQTQAADLHNQFRPYTVDGHLHNVVYGKVSEAHLVQLTNVAGTHVVNLQLPQLIFCQIFQPYLGHRFHKLGRNMLMTTVMLGPVTFPTPLGGKGRWCRQLWGGRWCWRNGFSLAGGQCF